MAGIERHLGRIPMDATGDQLAAYRARLLPWEPEPAEECDRLELERRAGRSFPRLANRMGCRPDRRSGLYVTIPGANRRSRAARFLAPALSTDSLHYF